jgi:methylglutaconyl-CoA hydratase
MRTVWRPTVVNRVARTAFRRHYAVNPSPIIVDHYPAPHSGNIRVLLLDRPASRNALSKRLIADLRRHIDHIKAENGVGATRALIIGSANDGAFCAGADLKERKGMSSEE